MRALRGDQHVLITLFSGGLLLAPHVALLAPGEVAALLFGLFVGSLAPDADATDAAIFHTRVPGLRGVTRRIADVTGGVLPIFGYLIRYGEYYPAAGVFWFLSRGRLKAGHRGVLHSLLGVVLITALTGLYMGVALRLLGWSAPALLALGVAGFAAGALLHLAEDSCTPGGIAWLYPLSERRIRGRLRTGGRSDLRTRFFATALGAAMWGCVLLRFWLGAPADTVTQVSVFLFCALWTFFWLAARS
ncbi:MAG TPA: metal-dependent hydrolase [Methanoregulaceae archaeon]|nr:metal-dependent hydrolase [Methanoregulaceae archaeon]